MPIIGPSYAPWDTVGQIPLNSPKQLQRTLQGHTVETLYCFTLHEIFNTDEVFRQTRSSPNWQGGIATMATCKHQMRTWLTPEQWEAGVWCAAFAPAHCADNALFFVGRVQRAFTSNYGYTQHLKGLPDLYQAKQADLDPRGDSYRPKHVLCGNQRYDHHNFHEPPTEHTRMELGSDKQPKWLKDIRYILRGKRPPVLMFGPSFLFNKGCLWSDLTPGRANLKVSVDQFLTKLRSEP